MRWVIGDIHGMLLPLRALLSHIDSQDPSPEFLFVGDYINRGPDSKGVIDLLLTLKNARFCRGNHDDVFDQLLNSKSFIGKTGDDDHLASYHWFMQYGLDQTLLSYGADPNLITEVDRTPTTKSFRELMSIVPDSHRQFIRHLPGVIEDKDIFVAHAKWEPESASEPSIANRLARSEPLRQSILWRRFTSTEIAATKSWTRHGFFGHTPVQNYHDPDSPFSDNLPLTGPRITLLDTACALLPEGRLTAWCVERRSYSQSSRSAEIVPP